MNLQPAHEIDLQHGGAAVTLRASLRAAVALSDYPEGFAGLVHEITRQSLTATRAVILAAATDRREARSYLRQTAILPLASFLPNNQAAALAILAALFQAGDDAQTDAPSQGGKSKDTTPGKPWREHYSDLFRFGTGWLGWPPETVWTASPAELSEAFAAHADRLIAMNGGSKDEDPADNGVNIYTPEKMREIEELGFDPAFDRAALHKLKASI